MTIEIANRLCAYRKKFGFSQEELAEKVGVSRQAVSKWERAEASPDTDNLITLSKIYGVTLDELLNHDPAANAQNEAAESETAENEAQYEGGVSFKNGIHVNSKNGDRVHIDFSGINVEEAGGDKVHVGFDGIYVNENGHATVYTDKDGVHIDHKGKISSKREKFHKIWDAFPYPMLAVIAYLLFGFFEVCGGWAFGWIIFLTIPIYYSVGEMIAYMNPSKFCYPVLVTIVFLYFGFWEGLWHPMWMLFLTIPLYYFICSFVKKLIRHARGEDVDFSDDDDDDDD